ncbi:dihydrofolate reductase [Litorivivens sp.]|uniref:dihydrofolate reductase n=1 Tax=Litorivivens sp. TaxID=2020868 RepID=UPI0035659238
MTCLAMIAAMSRNRVIGRDNALPWHISADLKHFKATTLGKPVVMGRKTFDSIGRPLPGRTNIVVTRQPGWHADGVRIARSTEQALQLAAEVAEADGVAEVMVIGGEQLYRSLLPHAQRLYLTQVQAEIEGDAYFPALDEGWVKVSEQPGMEGDWRFSFVVYERGA